MSDAVIEALSADRDAVLEICGRLGEADWQAGSGCPGWSVQDLVAHLASLFWMTVDPAVLPDVSGLPTERAQDAYVEAKRQLSPAEVVADYESVSAQALGRLGGLAAHDFEVPLGDLGTYPANVVPKAFCFDHYTHIRCDLFPPRGPLAGEPPPPDELRLVPALDWIEAALTQQNQAAAGSLTGPVEIVVTGPAARTILLGPAGDPAASVRTGADAFVRWVTHRARWEDVGAETSGDEGLLGTLRTFRVF
jgi:uncharacterized protein (TIGR03083 family)